MDFDPNAQVAAENLNPVNPVTTNPVEVAEDSEEEKLKREMEVGEHDIVIEEDFQINLEVQDVSGFDMESLTEDSSSENEAAPEIGTEQSGNITF